MSILCKMLGHKMPSRNGKGWWSPGEQYARIDHTVADATGNVHASINAECQRCGQDYLVCRIHLPKGFKLPKS